MKKCITLVLLAFCISALLCVNGEAKKRPFIRGVFVTWYPMCTPGSVCCHSSGWQNERNLLYYGSNSLHVNHTWGWEYPYAEWLDSICNYSNGAVRNGYGLDSLANTACSWPDAAWRQAAQECHETATLIRQPPDSLAMTAVDSLRNGISISYN